MKLDLAGDRTVEATPDAVQDALALVGGDLDYVILEDKRGRFMQFDGEVLEVGGTEQFLRAKDNTMVRRAFLSFLNGDHEWRELTNWEVIDTPSGAAARWFGIAIVILCAAALYWIVAKVIAAFS